MKTFKLLFLAVLVSFSTSCSKDDIEDPSTAVETESFNIAYNSAISEISVNGGPWQPSANFESFVSIDDFEPATGVDFGILHNWSDEEIIIRSDLHELYSIDENSLLTSYRINSNILYVKMPEMHTYFDDADSIIFFTLNTKKQ